MSYNKNYHQEKGKKTWHICAVLIVLLLCILGILGGLIYTFKHALSSPSEITLFNNITDVFSNDDSDEKLIVHY